MIHTLALYALGALAVAGALAMLFQTEPLRAALAMLLILIATAGIYILLSAQLIAFLQVIVYAGAIMTLFVVAINTLPLDAGGEKRARPAWPVLAALAGAAILLAELTHIAMTVKERLELAFISENVYGLAALIFGPYAFQFELLSLLILTGIVGAVTAAKRKL